MMRDASSADHGISGGDLSKAAEAELEDGGESWEALDHFSKDGEEHDVASNFY